MWKNKVVFKELFLLFLVVMLSACGKEERVEIPEKAFDIDYTEEPAIRLPEQVICGQESAWIITTVKDDFIYQLDFYTGKVGLEKIEWQPEEGECFIINIAERNGTLYAEIWNKEESTIEIRRQSAGGWNDVTSIKTENLEGYAVMGSSFFVDSNGNVYLVNGDMVARFDEEGKQTCTYELRGEICFFQENEKGYVECVTADEDEITLYELIENKVEEKWIFKNSTGKVHGISSSEEGTLCLATNQELLFLDKQLGILMARTDLVKLGISSVLDGYYDAEAGRLRLCGVIGNGEGLYYSLFSERDVSAEQRTELVYGMLGGLNADTTTSIWTAINTFNRENQDYYVTIKNYNNNSERLHADMAAGKGPDIIDMTYSEYYEFYVKNGYLEDLSPYLEQSQYRDDIIWNVLDTYEIDGGLYVLVPQFQLRGLLLHPEYEALVEEWNIETFLALIEKNQWEKDIFGVSVGDPETLLYYMLCGRQEEFIDWEQRTASFETGEFMTMLSLCKEYAMADWSGAKEWTYEELKKNTLCMQSNFCGRFSYYLFHTDIYGREYPIYGYPTLSGQTYGIIACSDSCAIYAGSKQKEGAWKFVESLLWESNQKYSGVAEPGFPIRISVLEEMEEEAKKDQVRSGGEMLTITEREIAIMEDIIYNGSLSRVLIDPNIWVVIQEETDSYFAGDKSAQETAHIIQNRVQLILDE